MRLEWLPWHTQLIHTPHLQQASSSGTATLDEQHSHYCYARVAVE
jgi:hypothetical protein